MPFHLTLQQMRLFEAVARHRSFSRASEELFLSQPAVSIQVKRLEGSIGTPLLERVGKRIYLTATGEEVYAACRDILARLESLKTTVDDMQGVVKGKLRISAVTTAKYTLPHLLGAFVQRYPEVDVSLKVTNRRDVLSDLALNESDMVVMGQVPPEIEVEVHPFLENRLVLAAPTDHRLAKRRRVPLKELEGERLLVREAASGTRRATEQLFAEHGVSFTVRMELGSTEAIKQAVMAGLGISVLPLNSLALELATGRVALLDVHGFPLLRHWHVVYPRTKKLSLAARTFIEFLATDAEVVVARLMQQDGDAEPPRGGRCSQ